MTTTVDPVCEEDAECMREMALALNAALIFLHTLLYACEMTPMQRQHCRALEWTARGVLAQATRLGLIDAPHP
jgi:hypothetical protein